MDDERDDDERVLGRSRTATVLGRDRTAEVLGRSHEPVAAPAAPRDEVTAPAVRAVRAESPSALDRPADDTADEPELIQPRTREQRHGDIADLHRVDDPDVRDFIRDNPDADIWDWQRWVDHGRLRGREQRQYLAENGTRLAREARMRRGGGRR